MDVGEAEYRKVQVLGRSSYAVTLPKDWVRDRKLDSGSVVVVTVDKKGILHVMPEVMHSEKEEPAEKKLDATDITTGGALASTIKACYKIGYENINIRHPGGLRPDLIREIHEAVDSLYGTLVVKESANETVVHTSIDVRTFTVSSLISRMGSFFLYLSEEVEKALREGVLQDPTTVEYRAREVDKIYSLLVRQLVQGVKSQQVASRVGLADVIQCLGSRMVAKALKDMTRSMFMISGVANQASKGRKEDVEEIIRFISEIRAMYDKAYQALRREDVERAAEILGEEDSFHNKLVDFERSLPKEEDQRSVISAEVSFVWELQNVLRSIMILAEIAVNRTVEREEM